MIKWLTLIFMLSLLVGCGSGNNIYSGQSSQNAANTVAEEVYYQNYLASAHSLSATDIKVALKLPMQPIIKPPISGDKSAVNTIPYYTARPDSNLLVTLGDLVTRRAGESTYEFAKRVAITLRTNATIGYPYMVSAGEASVYQILGSYPVVCGELASAFLEIMLKNGIWANPLVIYYKNNNWDVHATVEIYDEVLNKWIIVDPTFVGVFKDNNGIVLNAAEIQAAPTSSLFIPFIPGLGGYDTYYIQPLTNLYTFISYQGQL